MLKQRKDIDTDEYNLSSVVYSSDNTSLNTISKDSSKKLKLYKELAISVCLLVIRDHKEV